MLKYPIPATVTRPWTFLDGAHVVLPHRGRGGRALHNLRQALKEECELTSHLAGRTICLQSLSQASDLEDVVYVLDEHRAKLARLELAIDFRPVPRLLDALLRLRLFSIPDATPTRKNDHAVWYWRPPNSPINLALYDDRDGKLPAPGTFFPTRVVHLELRLEGEELQDRGWNDPNCLLHLDSRSIMTVLLAEVDGLEALLSAHRIPHIARA